MKSYLFVGLRYRQSFTNYFGNFVEFQVTFAISIIVDSHRCRCNTWFFSHVLKFLFFFNFFFNCRLNLKSSACMVDCLHRLKPLIIYVILTVFKRFLMKVPCVIFYGLTPMIAVAGVSLQEVLDILLARYFIYVFNIVTGFLQFQQTL